MRYAAAAEVDWVRDRLAPMYSGIMSVVPAGYESYVRVFHPAASDHGGEPALRWADVALEACWIDGTASVLIDGDDLNT